MAVLSTDYYGVEHEIYPVYIEDDHCEPGDLVGVRLSYSWMEPGPDLIIGDDYLETNALITQNTGDSIRYVDLDNPTNELEVSLREEDYTSGQSAELMVFWLGIEQDPVPRLSPTLMTFEQALRLERLYRNVEAAQQSHNVASTEVSWEVKAHKALIEAAKHKSA